MDPVAIWQLVRIFEIAFITLFVGLLISRIIGKTARRMLAEAELSKLFAAKGARSIGDIIGGSIEGLLYLVTGIIVLQQLGLAHIVLNAGIILLLLLAAIIIFFAVREIPNLITGFLMKKNVERLAGAQVQVGSIEGKLKNAGLLDLEIKDLLHLRITCIRKY